MNTTVSNSTSRSLLSTSEHQMDFSPFGRGQTPTEPLPNPLWLQKVLCFGGGAFAAVVVWALTFCIVKNLWLNRFPWGRSRPRRPRRSVVTGEIEGFVTEVEIEVEGVAAQAERDRSVREQRGIQTFGVI